ncbi:MAG: uracil-DNA glycosylase [Armatimonadetes bacterium]|nr:uracil-DNA glycosylase [Armatimonadota bacterium]
MCGEGNPEATLALVGEAPGEREARLGRPFVGRAGRLLDQVLAEVGHNRGDLWITNVVKFRPTVEVAGRLRNRAPTGAEMRQWLPALQEELQILAPRAILCLGAVAAKVLIDPKFTLSRECGQWRPGPFGSVIAATYHPAYLLRLEGEAYQRALAEFRADLQAALATAAGAAAVPKAFGMNRSEQNPRDAQGVEGREVGR